jgi:hypothetical protein
MNNEYGSSSCDPCSPNTYTPLNGSTECLPCDPGTEASLTKDIIGYQYAAQLLIDNGQLIGYTSDPCGK